MHLAHLLRLGILPTGYIHPPAERALRDVARKRIQLVRMRTQQVLSVENILARETGRRLSSVAIKRLTTEHVIALGLSGDVTLAMQAKVAMISALTGQIVQIEARLLAAARLRPDDALLKSIAGVGEVLAIGIMWETGDIRRFVRVGKFTSYARCVDSARYSNGKKQGEGNTKNGNAYLEGKKARTNTVIATKALAHKLAHASYHILKEQRSFDVKRCFV